MVSTDQTWSSDAIRNIIATAKTLVPKNTAIAKLAAQEPSVVYADVSGGVTKIPDDDNILEDRNSQMGTPITAQDASKEKSGGHESQ